MLTPAFFFMLVTQSYMCWTRLDMTDYMTGWTCVDFQTNGWYGHDYDCDLILWLQWSIWTIYCVWCLYQPKVRSHSRNCLITWADEITSTFVLPRVYSMWCRFFLLWKKRKEVSCGLVKYARTDSDFPSTDKPAFPSDRIASTRPWTLCHEDNRRKTRLTTWLNFGKKHFYDKRPRTCRDFVQLMLHFKTYP